MNKGVEFIHTRDQRLTQTEENTTEVFALTPQERALMPSKRSDVRPR